MTTIERPRPVSGKLRDPVAVFSTLCARCDRRMTGHGIGTECVICVQAALEVWPFLGPIVGEISGS